MNVAERVVELLGEAGVEVVFGIGGTHSLQLLGAFERSDTVRFVSARNEQGAAYMGVGYARATRRPAVVITSTGPGALNALSGIADARWSSLPILHITTYADHGTFSGGIHESPAQTAVMGEVSGAVQRIVDGDADAPFWAAWARCTGRLAEPVTLEIYSKAWNLEASGSARPRPEAPAEQRDPAAWALLDEAAAALSGARSPLLLAGGGVIRSGAKDQLVQLAEQLDAPIITSIQGRGVASWDHPLYLGPWAGEPAVQRFAATSDACLVVGSKLSALSTSHWTLPLPGQSYRVDLGQSGHGKYGDLTDIALDAREALDLLVKSVETGHHGAGARVAEVSSAVFADLRARAPMEADFVDALDAALPADACVSFDMNKASFWFTKYLPGRREATYSFSSYLCMGSALPNAIGMAERGGGISVAVVGDGGLQMSLTELSTMAERRTNVTIVVFVDGQYGLLRDTGSSEAIRGSRVLGIELWNPDYASLAATFGFTYARNTTAADFLTTLRGAVGPTLIEVPLGFGRNW